MAAPLERGAGAGPGTWRVPSARPSIPVRAVEGELARLWADAVQTPDAPPSPGAIRSCTLNLVIAAGVGEGPQDLTPLIAEVMAEHPGRALLLLEEPGAGASVQAMVGAVCHRPTAGGGLVCGEEVHLTAGGEGRRAAAGAALSLLVANLPVVLWWRGGSPAADERFTRLAGVADRVLLDSARLGEAGVGLPALADLVEQYRHAALTDLQWGRLTPWRSLTAQFFDAPGVRPYLTRLAEVTVASGPTPSGVSQALLYAGWLGSRLGWRGTGAARREERGGMRASLEREGGAVRLLFRAAAAPATDGLIGISILVEDPPARFRLNLAADGVCVMSEAELAGRPSLSRTVCVEGLGEAALIRQELRLPGRDPVFEEALRAAAALAPR